MKHIKVLGITGGVGAGKSTVLSYLSEKYKARVIQLDQVAHLLMEPGQECYERIVLHFGKDILEEDGKICRPRLYQKTFTDKSQLEILNRIVHPMVKDWVRNAIVEEQGKAVIPFLVIEAALLLEDHYDEICDEIWLIHVDYETRVKRLQESRGYSIEKTQQILKNQKSEEEFRNACQFVVDNSSDILDNTYVQIDKGLREHGFL